MSVAGKTAIVTGAGDGDRPRHRAAARRARGARRRRRPAARRAARDGRRRSRPPAARRSPSTPTSRTRRAIEQVAARAQDAFGGTDVLVNNAADLPARPVARDGRRAVGRGLRHQHPRLLPHGSRRAPADDRPRRRRRSSTSRRSPSSPATRCCLPTSPPRARSSASRARSRARRGRRASAPTPSRPARSRPRRPRSTPTRRALWRDVLEAQSIKRRGEVEDVARAIAFFAGDDSRFVSGQTLLVDGGWMRLSSSRSL